MAKRSNISKQGYVLPGTKTQVLFFHGYTGSPFDLRPPSEFLHTHGLDVHVPLLLGHGTKASDLIDISYKDWLKQAKHELKKLDPDRALILGGLSMGALLAIILATSTKLKNLKGLVLFSPALKLTMMAELTIRASLLGLIDKKSSLFKISGGSDIADEVAKKSSPAYLEMPINGLLQCEKLRVRANKSLSLIESPVFMAFGKHDGAINTKASYQLIMDHVRSPISSHFYDRSKHVISLDYDKERLSLDLWRFLQPLCG